MRRTIVVAVTASAVVAAVAGSTSAAGKGKNAITLKLRSQLEHAQAIDNAPAGRSAGDQLVFTEKLLDAKGKKVGSDAATCTALFDKRSLCTGAYVLRGGQLMVQLVQPGPTGTYDQAITGGTGKYARATGTVTVRQRASGDRFTFHIRLPAG